LQSPFPWVWCTSLAGWSNGPAVGFIVEKLGFRH
jgi:hypothetical protein